MWSSPDGWMPLKTRVLLVSSREGRRGRGPSQATASHTGRSPVSSRRAPKKAAEPQAGRKPRRKNAPDPTELLAIAVEAAAASAGPQGQRRRLAQISWEEKALADYVTTSTARPSRHSVP